MVFANMCNWVFKNRVWQSDGGGAGFVPMYKKGDNKKSGHYREIALIAHANRVSFERIAEKAICVSDTRTGDRAARFRKEEERGSTLPI